MDREAADVVVLVDVDNTLLDNDRVEEDLHAHLIQRFGEEAQKGYWAIFEELRQELGYADYLGALQRFRLAHPHDGHVVGMSSWLVDYPFADRLYPGALDVVRELARHVTTVILTDGDVVFQPRKVQRSGIGAAAGERILIYVHKEEELDDVERRYPARHYVVVDDKLRILSAIKGTWGTRVTTVFVRQGHYAEDADVLERYPPADITLETIRDLSMDTLRRHGAL